MTEDNQIVAVGLLSATDLARLGSGFDRAYPIADDDKFEDLIKLLDQVSWSNAGAGKPSKRD